MEAIDRNLVLTLMRSNFELKKLYQEHLELEQELLKYSNRGFLTAVEEIEEKRLKLEKLRGVDRMMKILGEYRRAA